MNEPALSFGAFRLYRHQKLLLEGGRPVRLGSRALDILIALAERAGCLVSKEELVAFVWPRTVVEESSLRVHVAALRKVLGDGQAGARYITNQPGKGYTFIAPVSRVMAPLDNAGPPGASELRHRLPAPRTRMIGRADLLALLTERLRSRRLVTLVGPGGIGKTTMALALAERHGASHDDGVRFIDLAAIASGDLIPSVLMAEMGMMMPRSDAVAELVVVLREKQMLIVFDNCEHVIDDLAALVETLLRVAPGIHVLATSREPLRVEGEWLHRLGALAAPPWSTPFTAAEALAFPAVELFVERATTSVDDFVMSDRDAPVVCELCHRLDGNPLAIELAAARVDLFGLNGLSRQLDRHVLALKVVRRDAPPRHHTIATMIDWSYQLLSEEERLILNRLAVFQGWFPIHAATALVAEGETTVGAHESELHARIADLVAKSLLTSDASGEVVQFRMLELTRAYALEQLDAMGQRPQMSNRHATHVLSLLRTAADDWTHLPKHDWRAAHAWLIGEVRAALAWSFSEKGDPLTGCLMTAAVWSVVLAMNPFDRPDAIERALAALERLPESHPDLEMRLNTALASKLELVDMRGAEAAAANARALAVARRVGRVDLQVEALMSTVMVALALGDYPSASASFERLTSAARASGNALSMLMADRIGAQVNHLAGFHAESRTLAERVLNHPIPRGQMGTVGGGIDHQVSMRIMLSRSLWMQGYPDQAANVAEDALRLARDQDAFTCCQALSLCGCPMALWRGDTALADDRIETFRALIGNPIVDGGVWVPKSALIPWWLTQSCGGVDSVLQRDHLVTVRSHFVTASDASRAASGRAGWCAAELLRAHGEQLLITDAPGDDAVAERLFREALHIATRQDALAWQLRSATSLARLLATRHRAAEARGLLEPVYSRFTEGWTTADLGKASALLAEL